MLASLDYKHSLTNGRKAIPKSSCSECSSFCRLWSITVWKLY